MRRNLTNGLLLALFGGACIVSAPAGAETYKWTDAEGQIHYTDQPAPANAKELGTLNSRKPSAPTTSESPTASDNGATATAPGPKTPIEQEAEFRKRQVEAAEREAAAKKTADEAATKRKNCEQAQGQLKMLQAGGRITQPGPQGEREYMNDAQIAQEIERGKKTVNDWCR